MSSSPFLEDPISPIYDLETQKTLNKLTYELTNLRNEHNLLKITHDNSTQKYENLLSEEISKNTELQSNLDYLYKTNQELNSKMHNMNEIANSKNATIMREFNNIHLRKRELEIENDQLRLIQDRYRRQTHEKSELSVLLNQQINNNKELTAKLNEKTERVNNLNLKYNDLNDKYENISSKLSSSSSNSATYAFLEKEVTDLLNLNKQYETTITKQTEKIGELTNINKRNQFLREENSSLSNKLRDKELLQSDLNLKEIELLKLQKKLEDYDNYDLKDMKNIDNLKNENLILNNELLKSNSALSLNEDLISSLRNEIADLKTEISNLNNDLLNKDDLIGTYETNKTLNSKEIELLRTQLNAVFEISEENEQQKGFIASLEELNNQYKQEINNLHIEVKNGTPKRQKLASSLFSPSHPINGNSNSTMVNQLQQEKVNLLLKIKAQEDEIRKWKTKFEQNEKLVSKQDSYRFLQMAMNPAAADQLVKKERLDLLIKENKDLLDTLGHRNGGNIEQIPKSVYESIQFDNQQLLHEINQLNKKISKLTNFFNEKSNDLINSIYKYLGYKLEFISTNKIKLCSKYYDSDNYLMIDIEKNNLKMSSSNQNQFKQISERLINSWVIEKNEIPCFLSDLNLELYKSKE